MSNEATPVGEASLVELARKVFQKRFGVEPAVGASAPGRVNLIGEHVDYCEGYVLPVAIPFKTVIVGSFNGSEECRVVSVLPGGEELSTSFQPTLLQPGEPAWANYVKGVVANFPDKIKCFDAVVVSDVPIGAGVSSSASFEVAVFTLLEALTETTVDEIKKIQLCQKAEHEFPGMPCGIMDQYIVTKGKKDCALLIDCRSLESFHVPVQLDDSTILVVNSNLKHQLTGSEYPQRRAQCQRAAELLNIPSLRDAKLDNLEDLKQMNCDETVLKRAKHVVEEIYRTGKVGHALKEKDLAKVGQLFNESHDSLRYLMEVSCPELDQLVDIARGTAGVRGARMTGGGFGGCVVVLVKKDSVDDLRNRILNQYNGSPTFFLCEPSEGARLIRLK